MKSKFLNILYKAISNLSLGCYQSLALAISLQIYTLDSYRPDLFTVPQMHYTHVLSIYSYTHFPLPRKLYPFIYLKMPRSVRLSPRISFTPELSIPDVPKQSR